ncbi:hypothetical protein Tco_1349384 [Tanacetum coccineum]
MCLLSEVEKEKVVCVQVIMKQMFPRCSRKILCKGKHDLSLSLKKQLQLNLQNPSVMMNNKLKGSIVDDPAVQSLLDLQKRLKASRLESLKQKKQAVACKGSSDVHTKYYDTSDTESDATHYLSHPQIGSCLNKRSRA